jgi:hypothetical protein
MSLNKDVGMPPGHEHVWTEMTREVPGEPPVTAKDGVFCRHLDELTLRTLIRMPFSGGVKR